MPALIGALRVSLSADTAAFQTGMAKAEAQAKSSSSSISRSLGGIKGAVGGFLAGLGADAIIGLISRSLDYASSLGEVAQQLGVTTKELQEYRFAASQVGIEQGTMDAGLAKLTKTIGQAATGGKAQAAAFDGLGISLRDASGNVKTAGDIIPQLADKISKISDPARQAAAATALFGKAGQQYLPLLTGGAEGVQQLTDAAERTGQVLSDDLINRADAAADKLAMVKQELESRIAGTVAENADSIMALAMALEQVVLFAGKAAAAFFKFKMAQGAATEYAKAANPFISTAEGAQHIERARIFDAARKRGTPTDETGAFRDYRAAALPGYVPPRLGSKPSAELDLTGAGAGAAKAAASKAERERKAAAAKAERDQKKELEDQNRFDQEVKSTTIDELRARQDLARGMDERADLAKQQLEAEYTGAKDEIAYRRKRGELTGAQADELLRHKEIVQSLEVQKVDLGHQHEKLEAQYQLMDQQAQLQEDRLQIEASMARTAKQRREIELRLLDIETQRQRDAINNKLDDPTTPIDDWGQLLNQRDALDRDASLKKEQVRRQTMGPMEGYLDGLPKTADQANEALEGVAAGGIQSIIDGLAEAGIGAQSLASIFSSVAKQILADLYKIALEKAIVGGLGNLLGFGGGASINGVNGATYSAGIGSSLNSAAAGVRLPGFANGGSFSIGGNPGVDTNLLSINGQPRAMVSANERIAVIPNNAGGGRTEVHIIPTPYFDAHVDGRAARVAGPAAAASGNYAREAASGDAARRGRRRIP